MKRMGYILIAIGLVMAAIGGLIVVREHGDKSAATFIASETPAAGETSSVPLEEEPATLTPEEKGKLFEDYVVTMLKQNKRMALIHRNSDRIVGGVMDEASLGPDLIAE